MAGSRLTGQGLSSRGGFIVSHSAPQSQPRFNERHQSKPNHWEARPFHNTQRIVRTFEAPSMAEMVLPDTNFPTTQGHRGNEKLF